MNYPETLPRLTSLQALILSVLLDGETPGAVLREVLIEKGVEQSNPAFYTLMSRLEEAGLVSGRYVFQKREDGGSRERYYSCTDKGYETLESTCDWWTKLMEKVRG